MKVHELRKLLSVFEDDAEVLLASDEEMNSLRTIYNAEVVFYAEGMSGIQQYDEPDEFDTGVSRGVVLR